PDVQELIKRVDFRVDPEAEAAGYDKMTTLLTIHLDNGKRIEGRSDFGKGSPSNPFSYEEVAEKFHGCAEFARWPKTKADKIVSMVAEIESLNDLKELTSSLSG
ncbi:MAG: MmgE/PrpD family protein, partial [Desulfofustis sp.]|nr:MmgE/PrpD family protein [Desulfofustis sp.]